MTLDEYLSAEKASTGLTETAFAELVGTSQPHVNRLRKGAWPQKPLMEAIRKATKGAVTANDWFPSDDASRPAEQQPEVAA